MPQGESNFSDNSNLTNFGMQKVYFSPRGQDIDDGFNKDQSNYNMIKSKLAEFKLRFNQKFSEVANLKRSGVHTDSDSTTGGNAKSKSNTQKFNMFGDRILDEIIYEDLNNSQGF